MITFMPWSPILISNLQSATRRWDFLQVICISFTCILIVIWSVVTGRITVPQGLNFSDKTYCHFGAGKRGEERTTAYRNSVKTEAGFHNDYQA